jgi:Ubiquitin family
VTLRTLTGKNFVVIIKEDARISESKEKIQDKEGIPPNHQQLIFKEKAIAYGMIHLATSRSISAPC